MISIFEVPNIFHLLFSMLFIFYCYLSSGIVSTVQCTAENDSILPSIFVTILARNKAHTLPYFFAYFERLDYPKERISLWIRSDHNIDDTVNIVNTWLDVHGDEYHNVDSILDDLPETFNDSTSLFEWSPAHLNHIINLKESAFNAARQAWADYILFLDSDIFLLNSNTLKLLLRENKVIIAPVMDTLGAYSNFWCGMTEKGYYKRTDDYLPILEREKLGCFDVPMVHSIVLINLRNKKSKELTFNPKNVKGYSGPADDIIVFAHSVKNSGLYMYALNKESFGFMMSPLDKENTLYDDKEQLLNLKVEMMVEEQNLHISKTLQHFVQKLEWDTLDIDEIYLINLQRRSFRRERMLNSLSEMGINANVFSAFDGQLLNDSYIQQLGIKMLPGYLDPYKKRPLTKGEIGCFLSHFNLWKDMIKNQHRTALVFEDDLHFEPYFRRKIRSLLFDVQKVGLLWDLIYLGRKRLSAEKEPYVLGTSNIVHVDYTYWSLCYLISLEGAKKLIAANPLTKLVPVDEFFPIMFDRHPEESWKIHYPIRNLKAFSVHPLLVYPTHYTGEENYVSDTEDSEIISFLKDEL